MITLFAIVKSFTEPHIGMIQRNAIRSWLRIQPTPEILIFGNKDGVKEVCKELGVTHIPKIAKGDTGMELMSDAYKQAWKKAKYDALVYLNADILLPPTFAYTLASINAESYLAIGQRHNTDVTHEIDFAPGWWAKIKGLALTTGHRHTVNGIDWFAHRRHALAPLPDLYCGTWFGDNAVLGIARQCGLPIIDATEAVLAIHQQHDYSHYEGGLQAIAEGPESAHNKAQLPDGSLLTIADADMRMLPAF